MTETFCYKIRDSETGLWSSGGVAPRFNKVGKTWSSLGHLKNHLGQFKPNNMYKWSFDNDGHKGSQAA